MNKHIFLLLIGIFSSHLILANDISLDEVRIAFYKITIDSKNTPQLLDRLYSHSNPDAVILGYTAATEAIMAKVVWNPYSKFSYLFKSKKTFENAVEKNSYNVEIRFLRFAVEHHLPKYLGLSKNMQIDKNVIIDEMDSNSVMKMNDEMLDYTMHFLINSNRCSEKDLVKIRTLLEHSVVD